MKNLKFSFVLLISIIITLHGSHAQNPSWDKTYAFPGKDNSNFTKLLQTENSDLYIAGYAEFDWYLYAPGFMKIDTNGNLLWSKSYDFPVSCQQITQTLVQLSENSFFSFSFNPFIPVPIGSENNSRQGEVINDSWLLKLNSNGDTIFKKHFENIGWVSDLIIEDGKLIGIGSTNYQINIGEYSTITTVIVLDTNGILLSRKEYLTDIDSRANSIVKNADGNYLLCGTIPENYFELGSIHSPDQLFVLEIDINESVLSEYFSDIEYSEGKKVIVCEDGSYVVIGDGLNPIGNTKDIILWKFDSDNIPFQITYSGLPRADEAYSIRQTPDGGFIICGNIISPSFPGWCPVFFYQKVNSYGEEEWQMQNQQDYDCANDVALNINSGYYIVGNGNNFARLVKTDIDGNGLILTSIPGQNDPVSNWFEIYPTPGNEILNIKSYNNTKPYTFFLYDSFGKQILRIGKFTGNTKISTNHLPEGIYLYQISNNNGIFQSGKWVKK